MRNAKSKPIMEEKILLPPRYNHYQRDEWSLLYDPVNVIWIRVNRDGMKILDALKKEGTITGVRRYFESKFPGEPAEEIGNVVDSYVKNLVQLGFLHAGEYRENKREPFYMKVPGNIYMLMTNACNLRCIYCCNREDRKRFDKIEKNTDAAEMSIDDYRRLVEDAKELGIKRFLFTGGEPLLNPLTLPVAKYAKELGLKTELISNGLLIDDSNAAKIAANFDYISISLDSMNKATHEKLRGKDTYDKVLNSIRLLKSNGAKVKVNSVVTKANLNEIPRTWKYLAEELKCDFYTPALYSPTSDDETEYGELLPALTELLAEQERIKNYTKKFPRLVTVGSRFRFSCGIANAEIGISYDGGVYPCHLLYKPELKCGDLKEKRLGTILKESESIAKLRYFNIDDVEACRSCDFKYLCGGGCLAVTYNMYGNFQRTNNFYCGYLKQEYLEMMWRESVSEVITK